MEPRPNFYFFFKKKNVRRSSKWFFFFEKCTFNWSLSPPPCAPLNFPRDRFIHSRCGAGLLGLHLPHLALGRARPGASKLPLCAVRGSTAGCCFISLDVIFLWFTYNSEELMHLYPFWIRFHTNVPFDLWADPFISSYVASPLIQAEAWEPLWNAASDSLQK